MTDAAKSVYPPSADFVAKAHVDAAGYAARYAAPVKDPEGFWGAEGLQNAWINPYYRVKNTSIEPGQV